MKGIVFTEFLEMVEDKFGFDTADKIVSNSQLKSGGVYTAVGTYDHSEIVQLATHLSKESEISIPDLLQVFGKHLFGRFAKGYARFFENTTDSFSFLSSIENYIHIEVRKLYPDAELPTFEVQRLGEDKMEMIYKSERGFADFAEGLMKGCIEHFGEEVVVERENLRGNHEVKFTLFRKH